MQKILVIGYVWPEPRSSAAGSRMMELLSLFRRQQWQVSFASAAALSEHRADLPGMGIEECSIELNSDSFDEYLSRLQPDMVLFDRFFTEEQFGWRVERICPQALRVLDTVDLHSLRDIRLRLLKQQQAQAVQDFADEQQRQAVGPALATAARLFAGMADDDLAQREIAAIYRSDLSLLISDFERDLLQQQFGVPDFLLRHCALLSVPSELSANPPGFAQRAHFVSIGNFRHAPNWDAVLWLKQAVWGRVRARLPKAELHIYGSYPPPKAMSLHNPAQGFYLRGWADDAHAVMSQARVCLAPLRFGAGIKGKLADAMLCGTPSVTTSLGIEGMCGTLPWAGIVADTVDGLVDAAVSLYEDESLWRQAQQRGELILQQRFNHEVIAEELLVSLRTAYQQLQQRRTQNFTGAMLRHHLHKSTQYMSQWIAAKNAVQTGKRA